MNNANNERCLTLGDRVTCYFRSLDGKVKVTGRFVAHFYGSITVALDAPVEFKPGDVRHVCWIGRRDRASAEIEVIECATPSKDEIEGDWQGASLNEAGLTRFGLSDHPWALDSGCD